MRSEGGGEGCVGVWDAIGELELRLEAKEESPDVLLLA
jgi:hypothetical protein